MLRAVRSDWSTIDLRVARSVLLTVARSVDGMDHTLVECWADLLVGKMAAR